MANNRLDIGFLTAHLVQEDNRLYQALVRIVNTFEDLKITSTATVIEPPGPIRNFALFGTEATTPEPVDFTTEPGFALVHVEFYPPSPAINDFDRVKCWITVSGGDELEVNTITHPIGVATIGEGTIRVAVPTATDWLVVRLWGASGSENTQNTLVVNSGVGQTPFILLGTLTAYSPVGVPAAPPAPNVAGVTTTIEYLSLDMDTIGDDATIPVKYRWRLATAVITYGETRPDHISVDIITYTDNTFAQVAQTGPLREWIDPPVSGTTTLEPTDWWELPAYGERFKLQIRSSNSQSVDTDPPFLSADLGVAAGDIVPTVPNVTGVTGTIEYRQAGGNVVSSAVGPIEAWRLSSYVVTFPALTRGAVGYFEVHLEVATDSSFATVVQTSPLIGHSEVPLLGNFIGGMDEFWELPEDGAQFRLLVRVFTVDGIPTDPPLYSSNLNVSALPTQSNIISITGASIAGVDRDTYGYTFTIVIPVARSLIEAIYVYSIANIGGTDTRQEIAHPNIPVSGNLIDTTINDFLRPAVAESHRVEAEVLTSYGDILTLVQSATFTVSPRIPPEVGTSGTNMIAANLVVTRVSPIIYTADGVESTELLVSWNHPSNTDAEEVQVTVTNPSDTGDTDRQTHKERIGDVAGYGAARLIRIGPWPTETETTRVKVWTINLDGVRLSNPVTVDIAITAFAFTQVTSFTVSSTDYTSVQGSVRVIATATAPTDDRFSGVMLYARRASGQPQELGEAPGNSGATINVDVLLDLPFSSTESIEIYAVPRHITGRRDTLRISGGGSTPKVTISVDPDSQPIQSYDGLLQVTLGASTTISRSVGRIGESMTVSMAQDATGGRVPSWSSDFSRTSNYPAPWPNASSLTFFSFVCMDLGGSPKWNLISERFDA